MYSAIPYWAARFVADLPYVVVETMIYSLIGYWIAGLMAADTGARWGWWILCLFGVRLAALGFCGTMARLLPNIAGATAAISVLNTVFVYDWFLGSCARALLCAAVYLKHRSCHCCCVYVCTVVQIQKNSIPQGWLWAYYVSFIRYPLSFLCANELKNELFYCSDSELKYVPTSAAPFINASGTDTYTCSGCI